MLMMIFYNMALIAQLAMAPLFFQNEHGLSPFLAGLIFAAILMLGSLLQPFFGKYSDARGRKPMILLVLFGASFFALFAGQGHGLYWVILGLLPAVAMLTAVRPVILAAAVEYSGKSEATTLGIVFTVLDGVGMTGALLAGLVGEFELRYAFIMAAAMALLAAIICLFLNFKVSTISADEPIIATVANPADP
jgi:DHA1 family tetracycline resistance protein-like MFS transporter